MTGLVGVAPSGCNNSAQQGEPDPELCPDDTGSASNASSATMTTAVSTSTSASTAESSSTTDDETTSGVMPETTTGEPEETSEGETTGGEPEACAPPEVTAEKELDQTFAQHMADCDAAGGYVQVLAACSGVNACAGFSIGDWDPDVRTDHTCQGMNGCNGLSCIIGPPDSGLSGEEILDLESIPNGQPKDVINGPAPCNYCHSQWNDDGTIDTSVFKVWVLPGSTRTAENWLDRSAAAQERIVAFGAHGVFDDNGIAYAGMKGYVQSFSRAEIERVVAHIRTLEPIISTYKFEDP